MTKLVKAETILYGWATGKVKPSAVHVAMAKLGLVVDLRKGWANVLEVADVATGELWEVAI